MRRSIRVTLFVYSIVTLLLSAFVSLAFSGSFIGRSVRRTQEAMLHGGGDLASPATIAAHAFSLLVPAVLGVSVVCGIILGWMLTRLIVPPLAALESLAQERVRAPNRTESALMHGQAPNEVLEIAQAFRETVRLLDEEKREILRQKELLSETQASLVQNSKLASVGRLAAGVAHEIGNPLSAVDGYLRLLQQGLPPKDEQDALERSLRELQRIHEVIRNLLTYARKGEASHEPLTTFGIHEAVNETLQLLKAHPLMRGIQVENLVGGIRVQGHRNRLSQVLLNLCLNAAHALREVGHPVLRITAHQAGELVTLEIADNGPGIAPEHIDQIFDPFFTTKGPGEGTGLGLSISRSLMESMGGSLQAQSSRSETTSTIMTLTLAAAEPAASSPSVGIDATLEG